MSTRRFPIDWPLVIVALLLSVYGISIVYSAGQTDVLTGVARLWRNQLIWFCVSIAAAYFVSRFTVRMLDWLTWPMYGATIAVLMLLLVVGRGAGTAASSKSWLAIGSVRIGQPAELAKVTVVIALAKVLSAMKEPPRSLLELWKPALVVGIPWVLIMLQPDLGTGIVFAGFAFAMLFWAGVSWPLLVLVASPVVSLVLAFSVPLWGAWFMLLLALILWYKPYLYEGIFLTVVNVVFGVMSQIVWEKLAPYQQKRLLVFLDPNIDRLHSGYHVIQSQIAIGSGGWFGKGFTLGTQKRLAFLPAQHTDFIFAVVGEEMGFFGVLLAITLFALLFMRITKIAERANEPFSSLVAFGLLSSWFVHVLENMGMTLNLAPITGIPLPFFSYGGSFMLASWIAIGILMRISAEGRGGRNGPFAV